MRAQTFLTGMKRARLYALMAAVGLVSACTDFDDLKSPLSLQTPSPLDINEIPVVDWEKVRDVKLMAAEFLLSPKDPIFKVGMPYRLTVRNIGDLGHVLKGSHFLRSIAIREVKLMAYNAHGLDGHADPAISKDGQDGVPKIPPQKKGARDLVEENKAEVAAEAEAKNGPKKSALFADKQEDGGIVFDEEDDESDGTEEAANPFAAEPDAEDTEEAANPFAAKTDADDTDDEDKKTGDADNENAVDTDADDMILTTSDKTSGDKTSKLGSAGTPISVEKTYPKVIGWRPVNLERLTIPVGHEVSIEFVPVRTGSFRIYSADPRFALSGMFGTATIE